MFYSPKLYLRDLWIVLPLAISVLFQGIIWWYVLSRIHPSSEQIFLHYNIIFGIDLVEVWWKIFYLPSIGLFAVLINYFLSFLFYSQDKLFSRLLSLFSSLFTLFLFIAIILIVSLNI